MIKTKQMVRKAEDIQNRRKQEKETRKLKKERSLI
jgi:hypothetical protein